MLQKEHPDISLATVYRNLALFKSQGTIASVATVDGIERFDGNTEPHVHFICSGCGAVLDVPEEFFKPQELAELSDRFHLKLENARVSFEGVCPQCEEGLSC